MSSSLLGLTALAVPALLLAGPPIRLQPSFSTSFGGSGSESVAGVAVDTAGNIWVTGTTSSFNFPVLHAFQPANSGTPLAVSSDAGLTWQPLPASAEIAAGALAVDPKDPQTIYVGGIDAVLKSSDGGLHFSSAALPAQTTRAGISALAIDPRNRQTLYAARSLGGVFKSTDGGQTWTPASAGLPSQGASTISIDPFHADTLWVWIAGVGYRSTDGGKSWVGKPQDGCCISGSNIGIQYDPFTPGTLYSNGASKLLKSTDNGDSWVALEVPFRPVFDLTPDPVTPGTIYVSSPAENFGTTAPLWKSTDGGVTWSVIGQVPGNVCPPQIDPADPKSILCGSSRSVDGGITWQAMVLSRPAAALFAPSARGLTYALTQPTRDVFVREYDSSGQNVLFSTYLGGQGNEGAAGIALDGNGNAYIAGTTSSLDFPVTSGAFQTQLNGTSDAFVAKIGPGGALLWATYLGGEGLENTTGIAVNASGEAAIAGGTLSNTFPGVAAVPASPAFRGFVAKLNPDGTNLAFGAFVGGLNSQLSRIAFDPGGNVVVAGSTNGPDFQSTVQLFPGLSAPSPGHSEVFVVRLDSNGNTSYATHFGGSNAIGFPGGTNNASGLAIDSAGNIYVSGNTGNTDFPVTPGAYQTALRAGCPYPSSIISTGFFSVIYSQVDDLFLVKISPDGSTALFSTLLGGNCYETGSSLAVDSSGNAWMTGFSDSSPFPQLFPFDAAPDYQLYKGVVAGISPDGSALLASSYIGAGSNPVITTDPAGNLYVAGSTGEGFLTFTTPAHAYLEKLTPAPPPAIALSSVMNAFSLQTGHISAGEIIALSVSNYDPGTSISAGLAPGQALSTELAATRVLFDGQPAYMFQVANGQVQCLVPSAVDGQSSTQIQVEFQGQLSNALPVNVGKTALGLLSLDGSGGGQAEARNEDGTLNRPDNPAARGSLVTLYFTGAGITNPPLPDGQLVADLSAQPVRSISASAGPANVIAPLPGFVPGIFQFQVRIPAGSIPGQYGIRLASKDSTSQFLALSIQ